MFVNVHEQAVNGSLLEIIKASSDGIVLISELQLIVKLPSIVEMPAFVEDPLLSQEQRDALYYSAINQAQNKKIVTYWRNGNQTKRLIEFIVFRRDPYYIENLLARFTGSVSLALQSGSSILIGVEETNSGLLGTNDSLIVWGQAERL